MTVLEHIKLLYEEALPAKIEKRDSSLMVWRSPTKINSSKHQQNI